MNSHNNKKVIHGYQSININQDSNIARCKVKADGYLYAYIIGDFNYWKKHDYYKLEWHANSNDGMLYLMKDIPIANDFPTGLHYYSYLLVDTDGNEAIMSAEDNELKPFKFEWNKPIRKIEIKASKYTAYANDQIEFIAIKDMGNGQKNIIDAEWFYDSTIASFDHDKNILHIASNIPENIRKILISCKDKYNGETASFELAISTEIKSGITIHYLRRDNCYRTDNSMWDIWSFGANNTTAQAINFVDESDFGIIAYIDNPMLIIRKHQWDYGWHNEWADQTPSFEIDTSKNSKNYYVIDGENQLFDNLKDVITQTNPKIKSALLDDNNKIIARLTNEPPVGTLFHLYINNIKQERVLPIIKDSKKEVIFIDIPRSLKANDFVTIKASQNFSPCKVVMRNFLDKFIYNGNDLGCHYNMEKISFRVWAPTAKLVELIIYSSSEQHDTKPDTSIEMIYDFNNGTHHVQVKKEQFDNKYYLYRLHFDELDNKGKQITKTTYAIDPYAYAVGVNGKKGAILDINSPEMIPNGWHNDIKPEFLHKQDAIIYEAHIRDFTISENSSVSDNNRGKFLGLTEHNTKYSENNISVSTGVDSLVELGITHLHLLPIFDYSSVDETINNNSSNRNWGYDPQNYNVPEGSYSTNPFDPKSRIFELRKLIYTLHKAGIRVVMDMVYNHMTETSNMDKIVPGYYFRTDEHGKFTNGSGCGNELATERPMIRKFVLDSIMHWINNYHIDGTRFDLMELMDFETTLRIAKDLHDLGDNTLVYGEPWKAGHSPLSNGTYRGRQKNNHFAIFNDVFRDGIRGSNDPSMGYVNGNQHNPRNLWQVIEGLKGSINVLTAHARETVNYADAHDNYTLWDQIEKSQNHELIDGNYRQNLPDNIMDSILVRQNMLALGIIITAQGIPFFHSGAEVLRTKQGDHNSYKSSDSINQFNWQDKLSNKQVFDYVAGLIKLRKLHPALRMSDHKMINNHLVIAPAYNNDRSGVIVSTFKNHANKDSWETIVIIYNASSLDDYDINPLLPEIADDQQWHIVVNHDTSGVDTISSNHRNEVPPMKSHSICVLHN
ncbi:MAG: type I pullulanase [Burkholderiales bacterium]|nr:type I pullulanase [Burkholderiales bacterium]